MDQTDRLAISQQRHGERGANSQSYSFLKGARKFGLGGHQVMNVERPTLLYRSPGEAAAFNGFKLA
jgi:hypothetical protein